MADGVVAADVLRNATQMAGIDGSWNALDGTGIIVAVSDTGLDNGVNNTICIQFRDHIVDIHSFGIPPASQSLANAPSMTVHLTWIRDMALTSLVLS